MNRIVLGIATMLVSAMFVATSADAARVGGGRSMGMQRSQTAPPPRAPAKAAPAPQPKAPATAPATGLSRWMPMLGGLALGGLLGSMFGGGGFGGGMGGVLLMALIGLGVFLLVRMLMRRREPGAPPMQFANLGGRPARPAFEALGTGASTAPAAASIPADFDADGFLRAAKMNFIKLQVANDTGDLQSMREVVTPAMFEELSRDIRERGVSTQTTDVVTVDADLLNVATEGDTHYASVRFSGMVREEPGTPAKSFSEVWNLSKPADGSAGWLLAGIQQDASVS